MNAEDKLVSAFKEFIEAEGVSTGLSVVTGMFVSLVEAVTEAKGLDASKQIKVDGGEQRDITIHAAKG